MKDFLQLSESIKHKIEMNNFSFRNIQIDMRFFKGNTNSILSEIL